jgi:type I restriction enzyme S subunit
MMMYQPSHKLLDAGFMVAAIQSRKIQKVLVDWAGGSTVGHVRVGDIRRLPIPIPPLEEQKSIATALGALSRRERSEMAELEKLRLLNLGLMEDLLTGRVRVTNLLNEVAA